MLTTNPPSSRWSARRRFIFFGAYAGTIGAGVMACFAVGSDGTAPAAGFPLVPLLPLVMLSALMLVALEPVLLSGWGIERSQRLSMRALIVRGLVSGCSCLGAWAILFWLGTRFGHELVFILIGYAAVNAFGMAGIMVRNPRRIKAEATEGADHFPATRKNPVK